MPETDSKESSIPGSNISCSDSKETTENTANKCLYSFFIEKYCQKKCNIVAVHSIDKIVLLNSYIIKNYLI